MKALYKSLIAALAIAPMVSSCIQEAVPTDIVIQEQLIDNPEATKAIVMALPGHLNQFGTVSTSHWDIGYPGIMKITDLLTPDECISTLGSNYNHFWYWCEISIGLGPNYLYPQYPWNFCYEQVLIANQVIEAISPDTENPDLRMQLAAGLANRAWTYLEFAQMYEVLPSDGYELDPAIIGLTLPKVTEHTTEDMVRDNPRLTHDEMIAFIKGDLEQALALMEGASARPEKTLMADKGVIYGLLARLYLWDATFQETIADNAAAAPALYAQAKTYAEAAMAGYTPLTKDEWLSTSDGFNNSAFSSWMACGRYVTEDTGVQSPNVSWTGWMATEKTYGYSSSRLKAFPEIGAALYNRMNDRDFRKLSYVAPEGSPLKGQEPFISNDFAKENFTQPYISIKFRPGGAAQTDNLVGCAVDYPLMRVEEMYFIAAEAQAHIDPAAGRQYLETFMKTYRYATYFCGSTDKDDIVEEIVFQKRMELWGEGRAFFDLKRLGYPCIRAYEGTNFEWGASTYNTSGRPTWYNFCITNQECDNNAGIPRSMNAPTPANRYKCLASL